VHAMTVLEYTGYSLLIFRGDVVPRLKVIENEWKGRCVCQYVCYRRAIGTKKATAQVRC